MAQSDLFKRYLDAGIAFTEMTRERAQAIVKEWVNAGEVPMQRADDFIEDIVERSRQNTAAIVSLVQAQVQDQLSALGLATKADIARLEAKINRGSAASAGSGAAAKKVGAKKVGVKKTAAKKSTAKKSTAKKSTAKKSTAKKSAAKKA
jgi:polyhydroxyalkanoate synthesis regulator phasin